MNHNAPFHLVNSHALSHRLIISCMYSLCLLLLMAEFDDIALCTFYFSTTGLLFLCTFLVKKKKEASAECFNHPVFSRLSASFPSCLNSQTYILCK